MPSPRTSPSRRTSRGKGNGDASARFLADTPRTRVFLAGAAQRRVCFRAVRALTRGGLACVHFLRRLLRVSDRTECAALLMRDAIHILFLVAFWSRLRHAGRGSGTCVRQNAACTWPRRVSATLPRAIWRNRPLSTQSHVGMVVAVMGGMMKRPLLNRPAIASGCGMAIALTLAIASAACDRSEAAAADHSTAPAGGRRPHRGAGGGHPDDRTARPDRAVWHRRSPPPGERDHPAAAVRGRNDRDCRRSAVPD